MPLGERAGDKSESRYCGVETQFNDDMPHVLAFNLSHGSFDFVVAPLVRTFPFLIFIIYNYFSCFVFHLILLFMLRNDQYFRCRLFSNDCMVAN